MKYKHTIMEILSMMLFLATAYSFIYKLVNINLYASFLKSAPIIHSNSAVLQFAIPIIEVSIAIGIILPKYRQLACLIYICIQVVFIIWVTSVRLFTTYLFWPFHSIWEGQTWMSKMIITLIECWISVIVLSLIKKDKPVFVH